MNNLSLFLPITKVDEEKRLVYGAAAVEEVDNAKEVFDYETSKPYIEKWSNGFIEKTAGKSCGNLRAMHRPVSAGKLVELNFCDDIKTVAVCAKIVDDAEWEKVIEGVYTGFSFGGHAIRKWHDATLNAKRYTLNPNELSLADKPCVPNATFYEVIKLDGTVEKRPFKERSQTMPATEKTLYTVSMFAELLERLNGIRQSAQWETDCEGGSSPVPAKLKEAVNNLAAILLEMTEEETAELARKLDLNTDVAKAGARNSKADLEKIQAVHDHACDLGAVCRSGVQKVETASDADLTATILNVVNKCIDPVSDSLNQIAKAVSAISESIGGLGNRVTKLESLPEPGKVVLRAISKEEDAGVPAQKNQPDNPLSVIKKIHESKAVSPRF